MTETGSCRAKRPEPWPDLMEIADNSPLSGRIRGKMGLKVDQPPVQGWYGLVCHGRMPVAKSLILIIGVSDFMAGNKDEKPKKFFGFEVSDTISYVVVVVLAIIFVRQVMALF